MKFDFKTIALLVVAVTATIFAVLFFSGSGKTYEMGKNEAEREMLAKENKRLESALIVSDRKFDSLFSLSKIRFDELENKKQPIYNAIKNTRSTVFDFDKEQLRNASAAHYKKYK